MNIVLTGFMGTGKSAVGRRLADDLRVSFVDIDVLISQRAGKSIAAIFESDGEAAFRLLESKIIHELTLQTDKKVIATGGGALLEEANRQALSKNGILVCLSAHTGTLLERLKSDAQRPLLAGQNPVGTIERLMKERQALYDRCPIQITTDNKTISEISLEIIERVKWQWAA